MRRGGRAAGDPLSRSTRVITWRAHLRARAYCCGALEDVGIAHIARAWHKHK